jgi:carbon monoxide dehydrogenase subunit G
MQLENTFTIAAPIDKAWKALNTPETVAPCFPGATLTEYEGDEFVGTVKVKLGPISLTYKGKGVYKERDEANHKVVIDASGRDSRGNGTANALVTGTLVADGPDKTSVTMVTDMTITGKPAQFGRGVINDVANKIIGQFAACVAEKLTDDTAEEPAPAAEAATPAATNGAAVSTSDVPTTTTPEPLAKPAAQPKPPMRSEVDAIDLLDTAGAPVLKRLAPVLGGALLLLIVLAIRRSRSAA